MRRSTASASATATVSNVRPDTLRAEIHIARDASSSRLQAKRASGTRPDPEHIAALMRARSIAYPRQRRRGWHTQLAIDVHASQPGPASTLAGAHGAGMTCRAV